MKRLLLLCLALCAVAGCASVPRPTMEEFQSANFGNVPMKYEETIKNIFNKSLYDPYSAHFVFGKPYKAYFTKRNQPITYGYNVDMTVNGKNMMGGYVGATPYRFFFVGEDIKWSTQIFNYMNQPAQLD